MYQFKKCLFNNFSQISYEFLFSENAVCHKFDYFDFIASSSEFDGYTSIQTYYVISKSNKLTDIKCSVFNGECSCIPLKSKRDREVLKNSKKEFQSFYTVKKFKKSTIFNNSVLQFKINQVSKQLK